MAEAPLQGVLSLLYIIPASVWASGVRFGVEGLGAKVEPKTLNSVQFAIWESGVYPRRVSHVIQVWADSKEGLGFF